MAELIAGRYNVQSYLGAGAMGEVFLATDTLLGRRVAIKRIRSTPRSDPDKTALQRLRREAKAAAVIHHPNVVTVHDLVSDDDRIYIVMEYIEGRTLADLIRESTTLDPLTVAGIGTQVAAALEAAHRVGVIHRDVKPANILLVDASGTAKLADFGIARSVGETSLTGTGLLIGAIAFMAPEVANGGRATEASDVYSLGSTLFTATEGHPPFAPPHHEASPAQVLARLLREPAPPARKAGPLAGLIGRMLATDPAERPTAAEVRLALNTLTQHQTFGVSLWVTPDPAELKDDPPTDHPMPEVHSADTVVPSPSQATGNTPPVAALTADVSTLVPPDHAPTEAHMDQRRNARTLGTDRPRSDAHPSRRRRGVLIAGVALVLVMGLVVAWLWIQGGLVPIAPATGNPVLTPTASGSPVSSAEPQREDRSNAWWRSPEVQRTLTLPKGSSPWGAAVDTTHNHLYVADNTNRSVQIFDMATRKVVSTVKIPDQRSPYNVAVDSVSNTAFLAHTYSGTVSLIDTNDHKVLVTIPAEGAMDIFVDSGQGRAYVPITPTNSSATETSQKIVVIDVASRAVIDTITLEAGGGLVALDPTTHLLYFRGSEALLVIDPKTRNTVATIPIPSFNSIAVDGKARRGYVVDDNLDHTTGTIMVIDLDAHSVLKKISIQHEPNIAVFENIILDPVSRVGYIWSQSGLWVVDLETLELVRVPLEGWSLIDLAVPPGGKEVYAVESGPEAGQARIAVIG